MPKVLNLKHTGYRVPEGAVYVGRAMPRYRLPASKYANPYKIGEWSPRTHEVMSRKGVLDEYRYYLENIRPELVYLAKKS